MTKSTFRTAFLGSLALLTAVAGCADQTPGDDDASDMVAPKIQITAPQRGAIAGDVQQILVTGIVTDDVGVTSVNVNGVPANVEADGSFTTTIDLTVGTNLIKTTAADAAGNIGTDTRAAMAGVMSPMSRALPNSVIAAISADSFHAIGTATGHFIEDADLVAMTADANPVVDAGDGPDCLYAQADLTKFDLSNADVELTPIAGGLQLRATLDNVYVEMNADYAFSCIDGNDDVFITADRVVLTGFLSTQIVNRDFQVVLQNEDVQFTNLEIDATGFPGAVINIIDFFASMENIISGMVTDSVVPMVNDTLSGLSQTKTTTILGKAISYQVKPSIINFDTLGATVQLDTTITVAGSEDGPGFLYTTNQVPNLDHSQGVQVGLADDVMNQLFGGFWAAGGMTQSLDLTTGDYGGIGSLYDTVEIEALLPPTVDARSGAMLLTIGDLMATFYLNGQVVTKIAVNGSLSLGAGVTDGSLALEIGEPDMDVNVLDTGVAGPNALSAAAFESLISFAASRLLGSSGSLLGAMPLPSIGGMGYANINVGGVNGYLMVEGDLTE